MNFPYKNIKIKSLLSIALVASFCLLLTGCVLNSAEPVSTSLTRSEAAAWYGAFFATLTFGWNIYKHISSGPKIKFRITPETTRKTDYLGFMGGGDELLTMIEITNTGTRSTTLDYFILHSYKSLFHKLFGCKPEIHNINLGNLRLLYSKPLPYLLEPGGIWSGGFFEMKSRGGETTITELRHSKYVLCGLKYSSKSNPIFKTLK